MGLFLDRESQLGAEPTIDAPHVGRQECLLLDQGLSFRVGNLVGGGNLLFEVRKGQSCPVNLRQRKAVVLNVVAGLSGDLLDGVSGARKRGDQVSPEHVLVSGATEGTAILLGQVVQ